MNRYVFRLVYRNGLIEEQAGVIADTKEEAISQLKMRGDLESWTYLRVEKR
ncbi:TPA: hypothetical protein ACPWGP_004605 [Pseudomonas aeruginosa]|nr:hypothetical protein [Pseudomonas aeruginosa]